MPADGWMDRHDEANGRFIFGIDNVIWFHYSRSTVLVLAHPPLVTTFKIQFELHWWFMKISR
jgi:hypothetical protein